MPSIIRVIFVALLAGWCAACNSEVRVTNIQLGRSLNADDTVAGHTTVFATNDTIYLSIATDGTAGGTLRVRWMYGDRVVGEPEKKIAYRGEGATEFHLQNAGGFPPGEYSAEVFLNGASAGKRTFRVEKK